MPVWLPPLPFAVAARQGGVMSAVILAVFNDYETADRVRTNLVRDGFPTDRVELTAPCELGRVACEPAHSWSVEMPLSHAARQHGPKS
jgi:hypothetical protein